MAFYLSSSISIGRLRGVKVNSVKVVKSMFEYVDKCSLKVPAKARLKIVNEDSSPIIGDVFDTAKAFTEGDRVTVDLGYNGALKREFEGFVVRVNFTTPVEVECEGFVYQLRRSLDPKVFKGSTLKAVLQYIIEGTEIKLASDIPDLKIEKLVVNGQSGAEVLELLKKEMFVSAFFTGNVLYVGLQYLHVKADVKYRLGFNTIKDDELKLRQAKNQDVTVNIIGQKKTGQKVRVTANGKTRKRNEVIKTVGASGDTGETKLYKSQTIIDEKTLSAMAEKKHGELSYDGYEGKLTAFLMPYCEPGYSATIQDQRYPERAGKYIVNSVEVVYGMSGARRIVGIGHKL